MKRRRPPHPSSVIKQDIEAENISYLDVATVLGISEKSFLAMLKGKQYLRPDIAVKLALFFSKPANHYLVLQERHLASIKKNRKSVKQVVTLSEIRAALQREGQRVMIRSRN